jgi:type IV secretory pathway TraG/TraD family ATPase VirD4
MAAQGRLRSTCYRPGVLPLRGAPALTGRHRRGSRRVPLDPRLLVLLDEAANTPLPKLPQWAATVTGAGVQLVTVWQSKGQSDEAYSRDADNFLMNHRTKLVYPSGISDTATID